MQDRSILEIKHILNNELVSDELLRSLEADSRKGVQQAVRVYKNKLIKHRALEETFLKMMQYEQYYRERGKKSIAGIDEVGRGPLAGPVVAAAVILPYDFKLLGLTDSKKLNIKQRESFACEIKKHAVAIGIGKVNNTEIDRLNIYQASILAMEKAVNDLAIEPDQLLIDAVTLANAPYPSKVIVKGDQKSVSIAAASVIAKVHRDKVMAEYHSQYPHYGFNNNQGYGTKAHLEAIEKHGITPIHRRSFAPVKEAYERGKNDASIF